MKELSRKERSRQKIQKAIERKENIKKANLFFIITILALTALFQIAKLSGCKAPKRKRRFSIEYHSPNIFRGIFYIKKQGDDYPA